jgi:hypothetical protein
MCSSLLASIEVMEFEMTEAYSNLGQNRIQHQKAMQRGKRKSYCLNWPQQPNCLREYVIHMMVKVQFGVNKYPQIFDAVNTYNRGFTQFVIKFKQVGVSREGANSGLVEAELHEVRKTPSTPASYIRLTQ